MRRGAAYRLRRLDDPLGCHRPRRPRLVVVHPGSLLPLLVWLRLVSPWEPGARVPR
jgi:hypothetical protein